MTWTESYEAYKTLLDCQVLGLPGWSWVLGCCFCRPFARVAVALILVMLAGVPK